MARLAVTLLAFLTLVTPTPAADAPANKPPAPKTVQPDEFEKIAKEEGVVVLDVRTPKEYESGHLKNAVLIDVQAPDFAEKVRQLDRTKRYAVYCAVGMRSERACKQMAGLDFPNLLHLEGGIKAWQKAGKPVEKK
jgi:rhodanese-related sulfurtransferase